MLLHVSIAFRAPAIFPKNPGAAVACACDWVAAPAGPAPGLILRDPPWAGRFLSASATGRRGAT